MEREREEAIDWMDQKRKIVNHKPKGEKRFCFYFPEKEEGVLPLQPFRENQG